MGKAKKTFDEGTHCITFGIVDIPKEFEESLNNMVKGKNKIQNQFIDFVEKQIEEIGQNDVMFKDNLTIIRQSREDEGANVDKDERSNKLQKAYSYVYKKLSEHKIFSTFTQGKLFRQVRDVRSRIYLIDDAFYYAIADKVQAYRKVFMFRDGRFVHKQGINDCLSLKGKFNTTFRLHNIDGKYMVSIPDKSNDFIKESLAKYYDGETKKLTVEKLPSTTKRYYATLFVNENNALQKQILDNEKFENIKFVRTFKHNKWVWSVQLQLASKSPIFNNMELGKNIVAVNVQTETVAVVDINGNQYIKELAPNAPRVCDEIIELDKYMDNSRRATNPDLYNKDDTIKYTSKEMKELGLHFEYSNRYIKGRNRRKTLYAKLTNTRKTNNQKLAKEILQTYQPLVVWIDKNRFKAWGTRLTQMGEKTKKKFDRGKRKSNSYGKQLHDRAPGYFTQRLKDLCVPMGICVNEVKGFNTSEYNPFTLDNDIFKDLNKRFLRFGKNNPKKSEYNEYAISLLQSMACIEDKEGNIYYVQRDIFGASKMLFLEERFDTYIDDNGKEKQTMYHVIDNDAYLKWFREVFYPKHLEYIQELLDQYENGVKLNPTIFGK